MAPRVYDALAPVPSASGVSIVYAVILGMFCASPIAVTFL